LAAVVGPMLLGLPLSLAQHLDARTVDKQVQSRCRRLRPDRHRKMLLAPADRAEVGNPPVQSGQLEQALRHAHRLAQGQIEQALDGQTELNRRLAVRRNAAPLAAGSAVPTHVLVQPDQQRATGFQCGVVLFPVGRSVLRLCRGGYAISLPVLHPGRCRPICATKPSGDKTSIFSKANHAAATRGRYSISLRNKISFVARKVPYASWAFAGYELYDAFTCD
jgi:hypothetical protein